MAEIFDQFKRKFPHLSERLDQYGQNCESVTLPAGSVMLREGEISRRCFFVEKGCLRMWFNHQGREFTFQFVFENQGISSVESFLKRVPSMFTIETISPSVVTVLGKSDFDRVTSELGDDPLVLREVIRILFERQVHYMGELLSFIRDTPTQRYERLLQDRPYIVERVPQRYIASYLGISPVHLSRIRGAVSRTTNP